MVYEPTTNFRDSNGVDLGKKLITQDYVATVYPSLTQSAAGFIANPAELYNWGSNNFGQIGDNTQGASLIRSTPRQEFTASTDWKAISTGFFHQVALKTNGTLWTWGSGQFGSTGDNTNASRSTPRQISASATRVLDWKKVSAGNGQTAAIADDGTLWCWGRNSYGQVGDNTIASRSTPRQISAGATRVLGWRQVSAGNGQTAAIANDGTLWCWGENFYGQLGINVSGNNLNRSIPVQEITLSTNWRQVSTNGSFIAATKNDGTLWCWGRNNYGQVGDNTIASRSTPRQISAGATRVTNWKQVEVGIDSTVAIATDGTLWVWGQNNYGQIGDNTNNGGVFGTNSRSTPRQEFTASTNWKQVAGGRDHFSAVKTDATLWSWGRNNLGQVGDNTTALRSTPRQEITLSTTWRFVSSGYGGTSAIKFPIGQ